MTVRCIRLSRPRLRARVVIVIIICLLAFWLEHGQALPLAFATAVSLLNTARSPLPVRGASAREDR